MAKDSLIIRFDDASAPRKLERGFKGLKRGSFKVKEIGIFDFEKFVKAQRVKKRRR